MPLLLGRLGGPKKTRQTGRRQPAREVLRETPLGRGASPTGRDPVQQFRQIVGQTGGTVPSGNIRPLTGRPRPVRGSDKFDAFKAFKERIKAAGGKVPPKFGQLTRPSGAQSPARRLLTTGRAAPRVRLGGTRRQSR